MRVIDIDNENIVVNPSLDRPFGYVVVEVESGDGAKEVRDYVDKMAVDRLLLVEFDSFTGNSKSSGDRLGLDVADENALVFYNRRPSGMAFRLSRLS